MSTRQPDAPGDLTRAIAAEIRAEMAAQKMSRPALSEKTGISTRALHRYLNAERTFSLELLDKMAEALGTTTPRLAYGAQERRFLGSSASEVTPDSDLG